MGDTRTRDPGELHRYRTEIPNIVLVKLSNGEITAPDLALYVVLKRTAGDAGQSTKSTKTLAGEAGMACGSVSASKRRLVCAGLITIRKLPRKAGGRALDVVTIVDVWPENMAHFAAIATRRLAEGAERPPAVTGDRPSADDAGESETTPSLPLPTDWRPCSPREQASSQDEQASSPRELKKEPMVKKERCEQEIEANASTLSRDEGNDAAGAVERSSRPERMTRPRTPTGIQENVDAFIDERGLSRTNYQSYVRAGKSLAENGFGPDDIRNICRWVFTNPDNCKFFAGKPFHLETVRKYADAWRAAGSPSIALVEAADGSLVVPISAGDY